VPKIYRYKKLDRKIPVKGETDWVFVDVKTGSPRVIPGEIAAIFNLDQKP